MTASAYVPFEITGIKTSLVGTPANDGSPGSALYVVPLSLSQPLSAVEQEAMVEVWDSPPSFSTMHRPGTARCYSTEFVLSSTTVEEVRDHHAKTLRSVVERVNALSEEQHRRDANDEAQRKFEADAHVQNVERIAKETRF
jgi:hypothetical protein